MLGDTTGYGYDAKAALDLVRQNFDAVLMGNHDSVCVGLDNGGLVDINPNYDLDRSVGARLSQEDVAWFKKRKCLFEGDGFVAVHGDFTAPGNWNYITESEEARRNITLTNARGEVIETRTESFIDGVWHAIARERLTYNAEGKRIKSENLAGQITTTAWDCCHKISEILPDGSTTTWDYDDEGRVIASSRLIPLDMTNVTWLTTCYRYDDLGRQTATWQTNFAAQVGLPATRTRYDQLGRVKARVDKLGNTTTTEYSPDGRTVSVLNPNTSTRVITRSADGDTLSITGSAVTPEFHAYGILPDGTRWAKTVEGETASSPRFTKRFENLLGQTIREERSGFRGAVLATTHIYDSLGRLVSTSADYEPTVEYTYDVLGNRVATTKTVGGDDPGALQSETTEWRKSESLSHIAIIDGDVWLTQTNIVSCSDSAITPLVTSSARQLTGLTFALPVRSRSYDVRGNVTENETLVDSSFVTSRQTVPYATNKPLSISRYGVSLMDVSVSAVTNTVAYDSLGWQVANTDGRGNTTYAEYNALGQRVASIDALGNRTTYTYDQFGNLSSVTDPLGNATVYEYDLRGRKIYEGGASYPVRYAYDVFGSKISMRTFRDEKGERGTGNGERGDVTTWLYDEASGAMTNKVYADGKGPKYNYTPDGKLSQRTWARGIVTDYSYDAWGSLTNTVYSDGTPTVAIVYNALGRQTEAHDAAGVTTFLYDAFGSLTNETVIGVAGTNTIIRYWDEFGRTAGYALNGTRQTTIGYEPDKGRISTIEALSIHSPTTTNRYNYFSWTYLSGSDLKSSLAYPNGLAASWQYDANNQLLQVCNATPTNIISQYDYVYDVAGRRISCAKSGSAFAQDDTVAYGYNARNELTNAVAAVDTNYSYSYAFDDIGNRITSLDLGTNRTYVVNNLNQYTSISNSAFSASPREEFIPQFDDDGNQTLIKTATGIWQVQYNGENRPILWENVSTNSPTHNSSTPTLISMSYDRTGRRVTKNAQRFVYDGYLCIKKIEDFTAIHYSLSPIHYFIWDPTEPVATHPLVWNCGASTSYYTHDGNKNVSEVIAENGDIAAHYEYAPFGAAIAQHGSSATSNPCRFSSEYAEDDTATVYYNYRHYESMTGRWLSRDPIDETGTLQLYDFVRNHVNNSFDAIGLQYTTGSSITGSVFFYGEEPPYGYWSPDEKDLTYVSDRPGFDGAELLARITHPLYIDLNSEDDFDPNAKLKNSCQCVKSITVIAHGEKYYEDSKKKLLKYRTQWGSTYLYEGADGSQYDSVTGLSDKFKNIRFCEKCVIEIRSCWGGSLKGLAERIAYNSRILDNKIRPGFQGCEVIVHNGSPNVFGFWGQSRRVRNK